MATNPMQRKARNSFLLGMLVMLLVASIIIGVLIYMLAQEKKANKEQEKVETQVYVLNRDVASGQILTSDMFALKTVSTLTVPENAITDLSTFMNYSLVEKDTGNSIGSDENGLYIIDQTTQATQGTQGTQGTVQRIRITKDAETGNYYKSVNGQKKLVEFADYPLVAKVDMKANSIATLDYIARSNEIAEDSLRIQEYNMLSLPVKLNVDDYIDVRFTLPNGVDYIVISKKRVIEVTDDTVWLKVTEEEINAMSNAIIESYLMPSSKLTVTLYVEPGLQETATPTYVVSQEVYNAIQLNPNILKEAKDALASRYAANGSSVAAQRQNIINAQINAIEEEARAENVKNRVEEELKQRKEQRTKYLEQLNQVSTVE